VRADAARLPFPDARFDQVLLLNVLNYAPAPGPLLAEAARVLRPGGGLVATALAPHAHPDVTEPYGHRDRGLDPRELRAALEARGLAVDTCEVTSRERRAPHFEVVHLFATRPAPPATAGVDSPPSDDESCHR
jgi:ArsR family transcriptional regulator